MRVNIGSDESSKSDGGACDAAAGGRPGDVAGAGGMPGEVSGDGTSTHDAPRASSGGAPAARYGWLK
jgi:hypothetical protein